MRLGSWVYTELSSHFWADLLCWCKSRLIWSLLVHVGMMPGMHICIIFVLFKAMSDSRLVKKWHVRQESSAPLTEESTDILLGDAKLSLFSRAAWIQGLFTQAPEVKLGTTPEPLKFISENLCIYFWK